MRPGPIVFAFLWLSACGSRPTTQDAGAAVTPYHEFGALMTAGNLDGMLELFAADATYRDRTFDLEVTGRDAIREVLRSTISGFGGPRFETRRIIVEGNQVAVEWILRGTFVESILGVPPDSGAIELEGVSLGVLENGLIRDHTDYLDRAALAVRLGL